MKGAEAIVKSLEEEGVKHIFGILGGSIMEVYDVFYSNKNIRHILMRHEQCAAHAAEGYARASGEVGVCMATSGPGATNLVTGIADAHMDSVPLVAFTGQVPVHLIGNDAFQEADIVGITMPITKHNFQITDPDDIPWTIKAAFKIASTRRPGPVLVDLPKDVQQGRLGRRFHYSKDVDIPGYKVVKSGGHPQQLKEIAKTLMNAEKPVILAGGGVVLSNASGELLRLAESLRIPVTTTLMGKGSFPEDHPLAMGMVGMHGRKVANNVDVDVPVVGDGRLVLQNLIKITGKLKAMKKTEWHNKLKRFKKEFSPFYDYDNVPIKQQRVLKELNGIIDDKTIITTEVGQCQMWSAHYLNIKNPRTFISSGGLGTMGFGFPAAIGAKVAKPDFRVIDVGSEGSFMMTGQDLATCVVEDIPVTVVLLDNRYLGMVKQWQDLFYGKRRSHTYLGEVPDFVKYAEAFNAKGILVEKPSEIRPALMEAIKSDEPFVIDVRVDSDEHILPMVRPGGRLDEMIEARSLG
jgi:acetolactate synthase-1/2/3 large subunit